MGLYPAPSGEYAGFNGLLATSVGLNPGDDGLFCCAFDVGEKWGEVGEKWGDDGEKWGDDGEKWGDDGEKWGDDGE